MSKEKEVIPSTEGVIDLTTLDTDVEISQESSIEKDLEDALAGKSVTDDPLGLKSNKKEDEPIITPEVEPVVEIIPEPVVEKPVNTDQMLASLKLILGDDITTIVQQNEEGEDVEVAIEDLEITPDVLAEIISAKHQMDLEESQKDSISTKGVSELAKSLVEIDKKGGDITELLRVKQAISDPIENLDLTTVVGQKQAIAIRLQSSNTPPEDIDLLITAYETKGILDEKANSAATELKDYFENLVKEKEKATEKAAENRTLLMKDYTKELKTSLGDTFELKPAIQAKIVKASTKKNDGGTYDIDDIYSQWRNDPEKTALLSMFLLDTEEYDNQISSKKRQGDKLENAGKIGVIKLKRRTEDKEKQIVNKETSERIDLTTLN